MRAIPMAMMSLLALTACATERFGRQQNLTTAEVDTLNCQQIDVEIAKVDGFLMDVQRQWDDTHGRRLLGILGDFGIGNHLERRDAITSADLRRTQLVNVRAAKQCAGTPEPRPPIDD